MKRTQHVLPFPREPETGHIQIYLDQDLWSKALFAVRKEGGEENGLHSYLVPVPGSEQEFLLPATLPQPHSDNRLCRAPGGK